MSSILVANTLVDSLLDDLSMDKLAGAAESKQIHDQKLPKPAAPAAPARNPKPPKVAKFDHRAKHLLTVEGRPEQITGTVFSEHADGTNATVSVHWPISKLTVLSSKSVEELDKNDEVTFDLASDYTLCARFRGAHTVRAGKEPMCTLHLHWPTANITPAPEPTRKAGKRKAESLESEPESKAPKVGLKVGLKVPEYAMFSIFLSMDDFIPAEPSLEEIANHMRKISGHLAHLLPADMPAGTFITAILAPCMGAYLEKLFRVDQQAPVRAMRGFSLVTSPFDPKTALDLVEVKKFLQGALSRNDESFSVVLGYDNARVVNETLPDMAFGAHNKRALEYAAHTQSPAPSDSEPEEPDFIDLRDEADSDSDHESDSSDSLSLDGGV